MIVAPLIALLVPAVESTEGVLALAQPLPTLPVAGTAVRTDLLGTVVAPPANVTFASAVFGALPVVGTLIRTTLDVTESSSESHIAVTGAIDTAAVEGTVLLTHHGVAVSVFVAGGTLAPPVIALPVAGTVERTSLLLAAFSEES